MSITGIGEIASLVGKFFPDKSAEEQNAFALQLAQLQQQQAAVTGQTDIDKAEATNQSVFVAGWRPFIGWVCGSAFAWAFVAGPIASYIARLMGSTIVLPTLDLSQLSPVLMGMLGLGAMRTVEKVNGIKAGH
jgi:hypothetical protein